MSWVVVGDSDMATLACDTLDRSFGPLHHTYQESESAKEQLREFGAWLDKDPRSYGSEELMNKYGEWYNL